MSNIYFIIKCSYCNHPFKCKVEELYTIVGADCSNCKQRLPFEIKEQIYSFVNNEVC